MLLRGDIVHLQPSTAAAKTVINGDNSQSRDQPSAQRTDEGLVLSQ